MTLPRFRLKGSVLDLPDVLSPEGLESVTFTPNTRGQMVGIGGNLIRPESVTVTLDADGSINGTIGVELLANDSALNLAAPLQWSVQVNTADLRPRSFWFVAPGDGAIVHLGDVAATPFQAAQGLTRGPVGVDGVEAVGGNIQFTLNGDPVGNPIDFGAISSVTWTGITGKPAVIAAGATQADARAAIGAGTSSLAIGTTGITAKVGDYTPSSGEITAALGYTPENAAMKAQNNGYASLDSAGKIPSSQLPLTVVEYQGTLNASTGTPALVDGTGNTGDIYRVSVAGTRTFGTGTTLTLRVGDYVIYNGATWEKSATTDTVASVATLKGDVTGTALKSALSLDQVTNTSDANKPVSSATQAALDGKSDVGHTHIQADISGLTTALAGKQPLATNLTAFAAKSAPSGAVVGTNDTQALTGKDLTSGNTFPTFNQNTTGSAAKLTTPRTINGLAAFDGSANISLNNGGWLPSDYGWLAWNFDPSLASTGQAATGGVLYLVGIKIPAACTITNVVLFCAVQGKGLTSGQNFAGLYQGGNLLAATADQTTAWGTSGIKTMALSSAQSVSAGMVYVAVVSNGSTPAAFSRSINSPVANGALSSGNYRYASANTGVTTALPGSYGTQSTTNNTYWAAVS